MLNCSKRKVVTGKTGKIIISSWCELNAGRRSCPNLEMTVLSEYRKQLFFEKYNDKALQNSHFKFFLTALFSSV